MNLFNYYFGNLLYIRLTYVVHSDRNNKLIIHVSYSYFNFHFSPQKLQISLVNCVLNQHVALHRDGSEGGERGWQLNQLSVAHDAITHNHGMEPPQKLKGQRQRTLTEAHNWRFGESGAAGEGTEVPHPFLCALSDASLPSGCSSVLAFYNKLITQ